MPALQAGYSARRRKSRHEPGTSKAIPPLPYQRASRARRCRIYQIGHLVQGGERKLVIGHAARSYVALHHYIEALDTVFVLAVRSPLEAGVKR